MAIITPTDRPKSVRNRCVIEEFGGAFVFSRCFLDFSVGVGVFVIGLSQIFSFFSNTRKTHSPTERQDPRPFVDLKPEHTSQT